MRTRHTRGRCCRVHSRTHLCHATFHADGTNAPALRRPVAADGLGCDDGTDHAGARLQPQQRRRSRRASKKPRGEAAQHDRRVPRAASRLTSLRLARSVRRTPPCLDPWSRTMMAPRDETPPPILPPFADLDGLLEVEVRSLAGESWLVVPIGGRVSDLRATLAAAAPQLQTAETATLFAFGDKLEDADTLPRPLPGENRLLVHIAPESIEVVRDDETCDTDAPESPSSHPASPLIADVEGGPQCKRWTLRTPSTVFLIVSLMIALIVTPTFRTASHTRDAVSQPSDHDKKSEAPPSSRLLAWSAGGAMTARLALEARDLLANHSRLSLSANLGHDKAHGQPSTRRASGMAPPKATLGNTPSRPAPGAPRPPLRLNLALTADAPTAHAPSPVPSAPTLSATAHSIRLNATWHLEDLFWGSRGAADDAPTRPVAEAPNWQQQVMRAVKLVPLASAALSVWRPVGRKLFVLALMVARAVLPAKRCAQLVRIIEARGLVPKGIDAASCMPYPGEAAEKKL